MNQNSLEVYDRISEAITTDKQTVKIDLFDQNGNLKTVQVPAFGYLKREIERLDANLKSMSGLGSGDTAVRMADGTFRKISKSKLKSPASNVTSVTGPKTFKTASNYFFESFLNPLLQIQLDVAGQVPADTEKIKVKRFIVDHTDAASVAWFDDNIKGSDSLNHNNLISLLGTNNVRYEVDEQIIDAPVRSSQYFGAFDVVKVRNAQRTVVVDGVSVKKSVKLFTLNKFAYNDSNKSQLETEILKNGDELIVNSGNNSTKYKIVALNTDTLEVELLLLEGYEPVKVGAAQLKIYKNKEAYNAIDINVAFDERVAVFIKPVDPDSNLEAEEWSPGAAFYSNELLITLEDGTIKTLAQYYKEEVADFGQMIKALRDDSIPPATVGVQPDAPTLITGNFKVVQVNSHLTDNDAFQQIKKLNANKIASEENLKKLDEELAQRRQTIATKKYNTTTERDRDRNELSALLNQRSAESKLYSSLVNEIKSVGDVTAVKSINPKYRVRGFWPIPQPKMAAETLAQEVVQFKVQYRYLSTDGKPSNINQLEFTDGTSTKTASFSNWNEIMGPARKRVRDAATGKYSWAVENIEDGQAVNINQLDIPIQSGEVVEIRIKALSEAGWPANPVESDWSDVVRVEFPTGAQAAESTLTIVDQNSKEIAKVQLVDELDSRGVFKHIDDSFTVNEKYFAHSAETIASGFLTAEQNPISLFDKLAEMQNEINRLREQIEGAVGELSVRLMFEDGASEVIQNNSIKQVFAGYYSNEIQSLQIKKGHIVTKNFKLILENTKATPLELIARIYGSRTSAAYNSSTTTNNNFGVDPSGTVASAVVDNSYYLQRGKYDLVPVQYQNVSSLNLAETFFNEAPYQSAQLKGQFINSRYTNLANDANLYLTTNVDPADTSGANPHEYGMYDVLGNSVPVTASQYIFAGSWTGTTPDSADFNDVASIYDNSIFMHVDHPALQTTTTYSDIYDNGGRFVMSKASTLKATDANGNKQYAYYYDAALSRTIKMSFEPDDQYLLGGKSCGSYLFMAPLSIDSLVVDADNSNGVKALKGGQNNAIAIDIIFQYRMTDYAGTSTGAAGFVGGISSSALTNLTYSKRIGIDIVDKANNLFTFDLEVFARYKP